MILTFLLPSRPLESEEIKGQLSHTSFKVSYREILAYKLCNYNLIRDYTWSDSRYSPEIQKGFTDTDI